MNATNRTATGCRWTARILSALLIAALVSIAIGEGMPNPLTQPPMVQLGFAGVALIVLGFLAAWRWELAGGIASLVGVCMVFGPNLVDVAPGVLYMTSHLLRCGWPGFLG